MKTTHYSALLLMILALSGCSSYTLYIPQSINTPMVKEKGDYCLNGHLSLIGFVNAQASVAPSKHVVLTGSYTFAAAEHYMSDTDYSGGQIFEFAAGYYGTLNKNQEAPLTWNLLGGYGYGNLYSNVYHMIDSTHHSYQNITNHYNKAYLQFDIDKYTDNVVLSVSLKLSGVANYIQNNPVRAPLEPFNNQDQFDFLSVEYATTLKVYNRFFLQYRLFSPLGRGSGNRYNNLIDSPGNRFAQQLMGLSMGIYIHPENMLMKRNKSTPKYILIDHPCF